MSIGLLTSKLRVLKNLDLKGEIQKIHNLGLVAFKISEDDADFSHIRQRKTRWQLIRLSAAVCGIEFCYAAETAFVTPILLKIGVHVLYMSLIWGLSPLLGFFLVPLLGSLSDRCKLNIGRRRPFIILLSCGIILGLILVPNGSKIGIAMGDKYDQILPQSMFKELVERNVSFTIINDDVTTLNGTEERLPSVWLNNTTAVPPVYHTPHPWSILFTILGVVILDFSCDACQSPCRAYLLDVSVPEDHSVGLSTFTIMAGLGGSLGYLMGGINWEQTQFGESLGGHVKVVFTMVLIIYLICLMVTLTSMKEVPLDRLGVTKEDLQKKRKKVSGSKYRKFTNESSDEDEPYPSVDNNVECTNMEELPKTQQDNNAATYTPSGATYSEKKEPMSNGHLPIDTSEQPHYGSTSKTNTNLSDEKQENTTIPIKSEGILNENVAPLQAEVTLKHYLMSILKTPRSLLILCLTNLFCWMSLVCYSLYFTDFVGQAVYKGSPAAPKGSLEHQLYEDGVRHGSLGMSLYSISCSLYSMVIERLVKYFGAKKVYICSQLVYTVGMIILSICPHKVAVIVLSPCAGIMYATLFTMPYILVAHYHSNDTFVEENDPKSKLPKEIRGLGTDIALVSSMVFFAQFLLSAVMGSIIHAMGSTLAIVISAAILSFFGALTATQVMYLDL